MHNKEQLIQKIREIKPELVNNFGVENIALFGSVASNENNSNSDIDIFVSLKQGYKTFDNFMDLKFYLEEALAGKVDLMIKESIRARFQKTIFEKAVYA